MHKICTKYAQNMQKKYIEIYTNKDSISKNMQKYARNMQEICSYMQEICTKYAKICKNICRNMYK